MSNDTQSLDWPLPLLAVSTLVVAGLYAKVVGFDLIDTWDDAFYLKNHALVSEWWSHSWWERLTTPALGYPSPLPTAFYALSSSFGDLYVPLVRTTQVVAHIVTGLVLFRFLDTKIRRKIAVLSSVAWLLHPAMVETVAWATNLKTSLFALFGMASVLVWERSRTSQKSIRWTGVAVVLVACAALCRPEAVVIPLIWGCLAFASQRDGASAMGRLTGIAAGLALPAAFGAYGWATHSEFAQGSHLSDDTFVGRAAEIFDSVRWGIQTLIAPFDLSPIYTTVSDPGVFQIVPGALLVVVGAAASIVMWRRGARLPAALAVATGIAWLPYANIAPLPRWVSDTYLYFPSLLAAALVAVVADHLLEWRAALERVASVVLALAALIFGAVTVGQIGRWESGVTLFAPVIQEHPSLAKPYIHVAYEYWVGGDAETGAKILDLGGEAFHTQRLAPFWGPTLFVAAGRPGDGVEFGLRAMDYERSDRTLFGPLLVAAAQSRYPLATAPDSAVAKLELAARGQREEMQSMTAPQLGAVGFYLIANDRLELGRPFVLAGAKRPDAECKFWELAAAKAPQLKLPPSPARCR